MSAYEYKNALTYDFFHVQNTLSSGIIFERQAAGTSLAFGIEINLIATGHTDKTICLWDPRQNEKVGISESAEAPRLILLL